MAKKKQQANDRGPAGNTASKTSTMSVAAAQKAQASGNSGGSFSSAVRNVGPVLSKKEATSIAENTGKTVAQVMAKAQEKGVGIGAGVVNAFNNGNLGVNSSLTASLGGYNQGKASDSRALAPLQGLQLGKGTAYYGYSTTTTPGTSASKWNGNNSTPATTTYNPIVLPRNTAVAGGSGNTNNQGGGNGNANDPYQDLRDQIAAAQQTITDLQNQQADPYPELTELLAGQQAAAAAQQQAMQEQATQQQKALQDLMIQQQQAYDTQMAQARMQQERMAAQAAEAQRQAMAVANAYVPGLEPSASSPALGDSRNMTRSSAANTLSNLSILTGMGVSGGVTATPAAPLAGLQIA